MKVLQVRSRNHLLMNKEKIYWATDCSWCNCLIPGACWDWQPCSSAVHVKPELWSFQSLFSIRQIFLSALINVPGFVSRKQWWCFFSTFICLFLLKPGSWELRRMWCNSGLSSLWLFSKTFERFFRFALAQVWKDSLLHNYNVSYIASFDKFKM